MWLIELEYLKSTAFKKLLEKLEMGAFSFPHFTNMAIGKTYRRAQLKIKGGMN